MNFNVNQSGKNDSYYSYKRTEVKNISWNVESLESVIDIEGGKHCGKAS